MTASPFFTVILPTRNRPELFEQALASVLAQEAADYEIVAVVDGSEEAHLGAYQALEQANPHIRFFYLVHRASGHGHSYSLNHGLERAHGRYVCFLDDDDTWSEPGYLAMARENILATATEVDVHFSNQVAIHADGTPRQGLTWIADLVARVDPASRVREDCYRVDASFLLGSAGFAHLNCSIYRRDFLRSIGGMDEEIRYENDRDVFLRAIDMASSMLYCTREVAHHNIPEGGHRESLSNAASQLEKKLYQLKTYDKGLCNGRRPEVVDYCRHAKASELKHITQLLVERGQSTRAACYARQALACEFGLRWLLYTLYLSTVAPFRGDSPAPDPVTSK